MKKAKIEISSGKGPRECEWVVGKTLAFFSALAEKNGYHVQVLSEQKGKGEEEYLSVLVELAGENVKRFIQPWIGTIQWIGQSPFRKYHKRKNWFIGIHEVKSDEVVELRDQDIVYQTMRSSGAGGQHVNKVSSAVRAIHEPTGLMVVSSDRRSQQLNRKVAFERLQEKVNDLNRSRAAHGVNNRWSNHLELERGNPSAIFEGTRFKFK